MNEMTQTIPIAKIRYTPDETEDYDLRDTDDLADESDERPHDDPRRKFCLRHGFSCSEEATKRPAKNRHAIVSLETIETDTMRRHSSVFRSFRSQLRTVVELANGRKLKFVGRFSRRQVNQELDYLLETNPDAYRNFVGDAKWN